MYVYKFCAVDIDLLLIPLSNEEQLKVPRCMNYLMLHFVKYASISKVV
jgi:hypothetical protein